MTFVSDAFFVRRQHALGTSNVKLQMGSDVILLGKYVSETIAFE